MTSSKKRFLELVFLFFFQYDVQVDEFSGIFGLNRKAARFVTFFFDDKFVRSGGHIPCKTAIFIGISGDFRDGSADVFFRFRDDQSAGDRRMVFIRDGSGDFHFGHGSGIRCFFTAEKERETKGEQKDGESAFPFHQAKSPLE